MKLIYLIYVCSFLVIVVNFKDEYEEGDIVEKKCFCNDSYFYKL